MIRYVTSFDAAGYEKYGKTMLEGWLKYWPEGEILVYAEDYGVSFFPAVIDSRIKWKNLWETPYIGEFVEWLGSWDIFRGRAPAGDYCYKIDLYKFCRKMFAQIDAAHQFGGLLVWIDGDVETDEPIPESWLAGFLDGKSVAYMGRVEWHLCASFLIWDLSREDAVKFFDAYKECLLSRTVLALPEWHDSFVVEFLLSVMGIEANNISKDIELSGPYNVFDIVMKGRARHLKGRIKDKKDSGVEKVGGPKRYGQLIDIVRERQPKRILEIGTWNGLRAIEMCKASSDAEYVGIDVFENFEPEFDKAEMNVKPHFKGAEVAQRLASEGIRFALYSGLSHDTLPAIEEKFGEGSFDLIYIDGGHSVETIKNDLEHSLRLVGANGIIVLDDYYEGDIDIEMWGCNKPLEESGVGYEILPIVDPVKGGGFVKMAVIDVIPQK